MTAPSPNTERQKGLRQSNFRLAVRLAGVAVLFTGFGFALVPLYDAICRITGINGRTNAIAAEVPQNTQVDTSRLVTVEFLSHTLPGAGLELRPEQFSMQVHPGEIVQTNYIVKNITAEPLHGQAIPSVTPAVAAPFFQKIECFCFNEQTFQARESRVLPVVFYVKPDIAPEMRTITLSYTFYEVLNKQALTNTPPNKL